MTKKRPKLAVWKFTSCDGCQLALLDWEEDLLAVMAMVELAYFPEATRAHIPGPYDISLVEGSLSTPEHLHQIQKIRRISKMLITIGACATAGGIQALRNFQDVAEFRRLVYPQPEYIATLADSRPIAAQVPVDLELHGCPINKEQLLAVIRALLQGRPLSLPSHSVCMECKRRGNVCVLVADAIPCLGPVTRAGCGALCPTYHRGCYGCFGPQEAANPASLGRRFRESMKVDSPDLVRLFRQFYADAPPFRQESQAHEEK